MREGAPAGKPAVPAGRDISAAAAANGMDDAEEIDVNFSMTSPNPPNPVQACTGLMSHMIL